ncbi:MAG TPA: hypothetical protein VKR58_00060 [Aquella sp.]|nr:hypothetical protein [Aquella sp.]
MMIKINDNIFGKMDLNMNIKNLYKIFAACLALSLASSAVYAAAAAPCEPAVVVVRHAEDNDPKPGKPHELTGSGWAHAWAYANSLPGLLKELGYCEPNHFVSSDMGSLNPFNTVKPYADRKKKGVHADFNGTPLVPKFNWNNRDFLSSLIKPGQSTFMALSKEAIWSDNNGNVDPKRALISFAPGEYNYINSTPHQQPFNLVYVFTNQDTITKQFKDVDIYLQLYNPPAKHPYTKKMVNCEFRANGKDWLQIYKLEKFHHGQNFDKFAGDFGCFY